MKSWIRRLRAEASATPKKRLTDGELDLLKRYHNVVIQANDTLKMVSAARSLLMTQLLQKYDVSPTSVIDLETGTITEGDVEVEEYPKE